MSSQQSSKSCQIFFSVGGFIGNNDTSDKDIITDVFFINIITAAVIKICAYIDT